MVFARFFDIPRAEARTRIDELLKFVELEAKRDSKIDQLSTGMKRRLLVARALLNKPRFIIADEPTTGLDPQARHLIWQRLRQLKSQGSTLILTTQYMEEAQQLCDRIVVMFEGKILKEGVPSRLIEEEIGREVVEIRAPSAEDETADRRARRLVLRPRTGRRHALFLLPGRARDRPQARRPRPAEHRPPSGDARGRLPEADRTEPHRMSLSYRIYHVFVRNIISYKRFVVTTFLVSLIQPLFYLITFGIGMGAYMGLFGGKPYLYFLVPGVLISSVMMSSSFECMYGTFVKMIHERLYDSLIATPVSAEDAIAGDIAWGAFRGLISGTLMMLVAMAMGVLPASPLRVALVLLLMVLVGGLFASLAMIVTSFAPNFDFFNYYTELVITPMLFFSGVFFPLDHFPAWMKTLAQFFPLTHAVKISRAVFSGEAQSGLWLSVLYVVVLGTVAFIIGVKRMKKRLVK